MAVSESERLQLPDQIDQRPEPGRHMAPAWIIEFIPRTGSRPCLQHQRQRARGYLGSKERLNAINQPHPAERHCQHGAAIVGGDAAGNGDGELSVWSVKLPPIDAIIAEAHSDAAVIGKIVRARRGAKPLEVVRRSSDGPAKVGGQPLRGTARLKLTD